MASSSLSRGRRTGFLQITVASALVSICPGVSHAKAPRLSRDREAVELVNGSATLAVSLRRPVFEFSCGAGTGPELPIRLEGRLGSSRGLKALYEPIRCTNGSVLEIVMHVTWSPEEQVLRKWVDYRVLNAERGSVLREIRLERLKAPSGKPVSFEPNPPQSYPAFFDGFFVGIEFPIASTRMEGADLILAHRPGKLLDRQTGWLSSRKAVYGTPPPGEEREAFAAFIQHHRPPPHRLHFNYNSWWTSPVPFSETNILALMRVFEEKLYRDHGASLDTFTIDMGWSDPKSVWEVNKTLFPAGFKAITVAAERMHSRLGVWVSPSSCYAEALDNQWAKSEGYETWTAPSGQRLCCLGGQKYAEAFKSRLLEMARAGARHFKLDGYWLVCPENSHGHQPGVDSSEAVAEGGLRAFEAVRAAAPDVWLESTCFGYHPSPWWLYSVNSVIGTFGDDSPHGRVPCPFGRETATTGRDYYNLQGAARLPLPDTAQEVLGVIHQTDEPFLNDAVTVVLRGHAFVPLYINPKFMEPRRWAMLAELMRWGRANQADLAVSEPLLPTSWRGGAVPLFSVTNTMPREPYGYLHWKSDHGLLLLRNPWLEKQAASVELAEQPGLRRGLKGLSAVSLYPEPRLYAEGLSTGSRLDVTLAPYETLVLSVARRQPTAGLQRYDAALGWTAPRTGLELSGANSDLTREEYEVSHEVVGPDWTALLGTNATAMRASFAAEVRSDRPAELLVILEGGSISPVVGEARLELDTREIPFQETHSESLWTATGLPAPESWTILKANLPSGKHSIKGFVLTAGAVSRASAWAWSYRETSMDTGPTSPPPRTHNETPLAAAPAYPNALPRPERIYLDSHPIFKVAGRVADLPPHRAGLPVERIDGVYLDSLKPKSVTQGWGELERNRSVWKKPICLDHRFFQRGLGTHANARITYDIEGQGFRRFQAWAGADGANPRASVRFVIKVDSETRFESGVVTYRDRALRVDLDVTGAKLLELIVEDGGDGITGDHADFADAKLLRGGPTRTAKPVAPQ